MIAPTPAPDQADEDQDQADQLITPAQFLDIVKNAPNKDEDGRPVPILRAAVAIYRLDDGQLHLVLAPNDGNPFGIKGELRRTVPFGALKAFMSLAIGGGMMGRLLGRGRK